GGRVTAFDEFKTAHRTSAPGSFVALWIDSEEPLLDLEATWQHLQQRDQWTQPANTVNEQVLFMTTCMEPWFVADHAPLTAYYKQNLQISALPPLNNLEDRSRQDVQHSLRHATRNCPNAYSKGAKSYEILGKLSAAALEEHLPSFVRVQRVLSARL